MSTEQAAGQLRGPLEAAGIDADDALREASTENAAWLRPALAGYEQQMLKRGFGAVSASRRYLTLAISRNPALRQVALGFFGLCGAVPPLRRAVFTD